VPGEATPCRGGGCRGERVVDKGVVVSASLWRSTPPRAVEEGHRTSWRSAPSMHHGGARHPRAMERKREVARRLREPA
jgi:hypothetical protein